MNSLNSHKLGEKHSPLWIPEGKIGKSKWFVAVPPIKELREVFYDWCDINCKGHVLCYSASNTEEWYGFSNKDDILFWLLRWVN